jgi:hypothetical protein
MSGVLAIISKAVFEKMAPKGVQPGNLVATDRYLSKVKSLEVLKEGGALFLVTVRPPDERLWLAAILEAPRLKSDGWYGAANQTPIADVTAAIPTFVFTSGKGLVAKKGALGMSLQTPRVLTGEDEALLRGLAGGEKAKTRLPPRRKGAATPGDACAAAVEATPKAKDAAAYAKGTAKQGVLRPLRFENHRRRAAWAALTAAEKKQLARFQTDFEEAEEFDGLELVDVVDATTGRTAYLFALWPFGSGVLLEARTPNILADVIQHGFALRQPDPLLRKSMAAAYVEARKTMGRLEGVDFRPTAAELHAAAPSTAKGGPLLEAVDKLKWKTVEQEHAAAIAGLLKQWGHDPQATERLRALLTDDTMAGSAPVCGHVAGFVLSSFPTMTSAAALKPGQRELLDVIAGHPKALRFGVSKAYGKHRWPTTALGLGRWLGTKAPPCLDRKLESGEAIVEAVTAAARGAGSLDEVAKQLAAAVERDEILDLIIDLFATAHTFTAVADLKIDFSKLSAEGKVLKDLEIARRTARLVELVRALLVVSLDLPAVLGAIRAGGHYGKAQACLLVAADALATGKKLALAGDFAATLATIACYRDFAEPVRRLLGQCSDRERGRFLAQVQCDVHDDNPSAWLYLHLLSLREASAIAKSYNLLPNEELTPQWLKRVSKADGAKIIGLIAKQYGAKVEQRVNQVGRVVEFAVPGGKPVALWASPPVGTLVDRAPWTP